MFSGKSSPLLEKVNKYKYKELSTIIVKHSHYDRYTEKEEVVTNKLFIKIM